MRKSLWDDTYDKNRQGPVHISAKINCYESHPPLHIGGGVLIGGNCCHHTTHKDVSLYVALDKIQEHPLFDPDREEQPVSVFYPITNMKCPSRADKFEKLIDLILATLAKGKTVHVGCIGGHGRTGLVIAAVASRLNLGDDPIDWVRENYCKKAVESKEQVNFLAVHYGAKLPPVDKLALEY